MYNKSDNSSSLYSLQKLAIELELISAPDASKYEPRSEYIRTLIEAIGQSQRDISSLIGVSERSLRDYLNPKHASRAPYSVQFALEMLAKQQLKNAIAEQS